MPYVWSETPMFLLNRSFSDHPSLAPADASLLWFEQTIPMYIIIIYGMIEASCPTTPT